MALFGKCVFRHLGDADPVASVSLPMRAPDRLRLATRVVEKINGGNRMLALVWVSNGYAVLAVHDWVAMLRNGRVTHEDLVAIYAPPINLDQVLDDLRAHG